MLSDGSSESYTSEFGAQIRKNGPVVLVSTGRCQCTMPAPILRHLCVPTRTPGFSPSPEGRVSGVLDRAGGRARVGMSRNAGKECLYQGRLFTPARAQRPVEAVKGGGE